MMSWKEIKMTISDFRGEYRWLSNFYSCQIVLDGKIYPSTEHAYQAAKTLDENEREQIRIAPKFRDAKNLGQKVTKRSDWDEVKIAVMKECLRQKFERPDLREKLLATGNQKLIEGNTWMDQFWGICNGIGSNHLGKLLMALREEIRNTQILTGDSNG